MDVVVAPLDELGPGSMRLVPVGSKRIGVFNCKGRLLAIEDRCSHDDGPLCQGDWEPEGCVVVCPRHGARFDLETGTALTLPAFLPVETFRVEIRDGLVVVEVPD